MRMYHHLHACTWTPAQCVSHRQTTWQQKSLASRSMMETKRLKWWFVWWKCGVLCEIFNNQTQKSIDFRKRLKHKLTGGMKMVDTYMCWSGSVSSCSFSPLHYQCISPHVAIFSLHGAKYCLRAQNTRVQKKEAHTVLRNTSFRRFLLWCREYFIFQNSGNCRTAATFAFFCHPRMLAFNALSIFMWNCSADLSLWHLLRPHLPPLEVCVWLTQLCEQWKDTACSLKSYMCLFVLSAAATLSSAQKWWIVKTSKLSSQCFTTPPRLSALLSVTDFISQLWQKCTHRCMSSALNPPVRDVQKNECSSRTEAEFLDYTEGFHISCSHRLVCWLSNSPACHGNRS